MRHRRRAPVSALREKLQRRLREQEGAVEDDSVELEEQFAAGKPPVIVSVLKTMHRYFLLKLIFAAALVLLAAVLLKGNYRAGAPLLQGLRFIVEWDLEPGALRKKTEPSLQYFRERLDLPALKPPVPPFSGKDPLPLAGTLVSDFGLRADPDSGREEMHYGIDLTAPAGTAVRVLQKGRVERISAAREGGYSIIIATKPGWTMLYRGLKAPLVKEGEAVEKGAKLGVLDRAGRHEQPHLHFELRYKGRPAAPPRSWKDSFGSPAERI